jgi:hypothetical protein
MALILRMNSKKAETAKKGRKQQKGRNSKKAGDHPAFLPSR